MVKSVQDRAGHDAAWLVETMPLALHLSGVMQGRLGQAWS